MGETKILTIRDVFDKERDPLRYLNTVIQVIDASEKSVWIEFDEFVLTDTLLDYLANFVRDFSSAVIFDQPARPIWLEGFYGSGKSHFAKIIGLLLKNVHLVNQNDQTSVNAIDFFIEKKLRSYQTEDNAIDRTCKNLIENLEIFPQKIASDTLFIFLAKYAKKEYSTEEYLESFSTALTTEFNHYLGLSHELNMAQVEKNLIAEELYNKFLEKVNELKGKDWKKIRRNTSLANTVFIEVYCLITQKSEIMAREYLRGAENNVKQLNIDRVLFEINEWVKDNLSEPMKGKEGKFLIILDEAGIYFGTAESRIGELQAAAEWITNIQNRCRFGFIFAAQQKLEQHFQKFNVDKKDYQKTEQRFKPWFLGKENIKTVVINRWLKKDIGEDGRKLKGMIKSHYPLIIDGTMYETIIDPEMDYQKPNRDIIFESYPFLPHQFPMMIKITQGLISRKIVQEQYGGKTRSILSMTRDVLENISPYSGHVNFIDDTLGTFINVAQIYDSIVYTLRRKEEDQTVLVEKTSNLIENPDVFTVEERNLPITFHHVAKVIFLLDFIEEIYSDENNISKSLFHSITVKKTLYYEKVKKLIDVLKKNGYVNYKKRELEDKKGNKREIWEYKIATEEEKKFTDYSTSVPVGDPDINRTFEELFEAKGSGTSLIQKNKSLNIIKLFGALGSEVKLSDAVKLELKWYFDPIIDDEFKTNIETGEQDTAGVIVLSYRRIKTYNPEQLKRELLFLSKKAFRKQKYLLIIYSSLNYTKEQVQIAEKKITENLKQIFRIKRGLIDYPGYKAILVQTFNQMIRDLEKDVLETYEKSLNGGFILSGDGKLTKINTSKLNEQIKVELTDIYSKINKYSYLGQIKVSNSDIKSVLTWDPKKKSSIPKKYIKSKKENGLNISLFDEKNDLQPNLSEQYTHIQREFTKKTNNNPDIQISGEELTQVFLNPPYHWKKNVLIIVVSAIVRNLEWDVIRSNIPRSYDEQEVIDAFVQSFGDFKFKLAEKLTLEDLIKTSKYLTDVFNKPISSPGYEAIDLGIREVFIEFNQIIIGELSKFEQIGIKSDFIARLKYLNDYTTKILNKKRQIERIRGFLEFINLYLVDEEKKKSFSQLHSILYLVKELSKSGKLNRYQYVKKFLGEIFRDFSQTDKIKVTEEMLDTRTELLEKLLEPTIFFQQEWDEFWRITKRLWLLYWNSYIDQHRKILEDIEEGMKKFRGHEKYDTLSISQIGEFEDLFTCKKKVSIPETVKTDNFHCQSCNQSYTVLKVIENNIKLKKQELLVYLENPPVSPPHPSGEKEVWKEYQRFHSKIGGLIEKIENHVELYCNIENITEMIQEAINPIFNKFDLYEKEHNCSDKPKSWEISAQACKECNLLYDNLIDLFADLEEVYYGLLEKINQLIKIEFPYKIQKKINLASTDRTSIDQVLEEMTQNIKNFIQNKLSSPEYEDKLILIKFLVDEGE